MLGVVLGFSDFYGGARGFGILFELLFILIVIERFRGRDGKYFFVRIFWVGFFGYLGVVGGVDEYGKDRD